MRKLDCNFGRRVEILRIEGAHLLFPFSTSDLFGAFSKRFPLKFAMGEAFYLKIELDID